MKYCEIFCEDMYKIRLTSHVNVALLQCKVVQQTTKGISLVHIQNTTMS